MRFKHDALDKADDGHQGCGKAAANQQSAPDLDGLTIVTTRQQTRAKTRNRACRKLAHDRTDDRCGHRDLERRKEIGHRGRQAQTPECLRSRSRAKCAFDQAACGRAAQPFDHANDHRKERQIHRNDRLGQQTRMPTAFKTTIIIGATARIGMVCDVMTHGMTLISIVRLKTMPTASAMPRTVPEREAQERGTERDPRMVNERAFRGDLFLCRGFPDLLGHLMGRGSFGFFCDHVSAIKSLVLRVLPRRAALCHRPRAH